MQNIVFKTPNYDRDNKNLNRSEYLNVSNTYKPEHYDPCKVKDRFRKVHSFDIQKKKGRDLKMYKTNGILIILLNLNSYIEAYQNIANENERYEYLQNLLKP